MSALFPSPAYIFETIMKASGFTTTTLHSDRAKPIEHGAIHKPIHNSAAFGFADVTDLVKVFQGDQAGFV